MTLIQKAKLSGGNPGLADRRARADRLWTDQGPRDAHAAAVDLGRCQPWLQSRTARGSTGSAGQLKSHPSSPHRLLSNVRRSSSMRVSCGVRGRKLRTDQEDAPSARLRELAAPALAVWSLRLNGAAFSCRVRSGLTAICVTLRVVAQPPCRSQIRRARRQEPTVGSEILRPTAAGVYRYLTGRCQKSMLSRA